MSIRACCLLVTLSLFSMVTWAEPIKRSQIPTEYNNDKLISNVPYALVPFDYQAAVYEEYGKDDRFYFMTRIASIKKASNGQFELTLFTTNWSSLIMGFTESPIVAVFSDRPKGYDVGDQILVLVKYVGISEDSIPIFAVDMYGDSIDIQG